MKEKNQTFKKVGIVLLVLGFVDLSAFLFCLYGGYYYASNLNIFAIIPGIFLLMSSVKTARFMRWLSLFAVVLAVGLYSISMMSKPLDLMLAQVRLNTNVAVLDVISGLVFIGVLLWLYRQLSNEESTAALTKAGYKTGIPKSAMIAGATIVMFAAVSSYMLLTSAAAEKAKSLAAAKTGNNYRYAISTLEFSGEHGSATVIVYNNELIGNIEVEW